MSENKTTNAQDGQQDTAARVMECWREMCSWVAIDAKEHDDRGVREYAAGLQAKADALRPELERLLARPTVPTDSDTARRVAEIRERERKATMGPWEAVTTERKPSALGLEKGISGAVLHNVRTAWKHGQSKCKELIAYLTISPYYEPVHMVTMDPQDAEFIAHARADVPWLLDTVDALLAERDAARAECERLREELAAIRAAMLEDVARDVDGLLEQAERFRRNLIIEARFRRNPIIEAQSRAHNTEASS